MVKVPFFHRSKRTSPEVVALWHVWPALLFAAVWLIFPHTIEHERLPLVYIYSALGMVAVVTVLRMRTAMARPNARVLRYLPFFDSSALAFLIYATGGVESDLWLFYYFQLIAGAMDPRPRTIELIAPLSLISYIAATAPDLTGLDPRAAGIVVTRIFFLFLTGLLTRQIARARDRLSQELGHLHEQLSLSQERIRISREIHDGIGHSLVNCILTLELCERLVCKEPDEACKVIRQEKDDLRGALDDMRDYVHHLRPADIETTSVTPLLQGYLARFTERTGVEAKLQAASPAMDVPPAAKLVLLRIVQEALTNAAKHSEATEIEVTLSRTRDGGAYCVVVDNGVGFDEESVLGDSSSRQGFGLRGMIDRAKSIGGDVQVESSEGEGTRISVYIPG